MRDATAPARPPPDAASLREAALHYLARYATTETGLRRVLLRRIDRWTRQADGEAARDQAAAAREAVPAVVARMVALGLINDAAFAETRAQSLALGGRSRRGIAMKLAAKGIAPDQVAAVLPQGEESELLSALILTRKRKIGPFRRAEEDGKRAFGVMARAGFSREIARRALEMPREQAEDALRERGG